MREGRNSPGSHEPLWKQPEIHDGAGSCSRKRVPCSPGPRLQDGYVHVMLRQLATPLGASPNLVKVELSVIDTGKVCGPPSAPVRLLMAV